MFKHQFFDNKTDVNDTVFGRAVAHRVKQTHSNRVICVENTQTQWIEADGIVTRTPNLSIGVITADCVPVLFYGDGVVGAVHAGWQGAVSGILENTVTAMDCNPSTIHAYIGPSIQQQSYEVSIGFEKPFLEQDKKAIQFFKEGREGKLQFDLPAYCADRLKQRGVENIINDGRDTLTDPNFHSHRGGATSNERNLSAVMIT